MSNFAIKAESLGKRYRLGVVDRHNSTLGARYGSLRDSLMSSSQRLMTALRSGRADVPRETKDSQFWALRNVNFSVQHGDVVGIIGRNGAGKSTLLKLLSEITDPTEGLIAINGRVAPLLEVGTGFHPELTGRENIWLNGSIMGMSRQEIRSKFDEIVDFAEVERFIDTQVKHYSSGMYMRLAFSVAAHLEPEILMVDEVLAVGDSAFQRKCLRKMGEAAHGGRTVLFVSHNMAAIEHLCRKGMVLTKGQISFIGTQTEAISHYLRDDSVTTTSLLSRHDRQGTGALRITAIDFRTADGTLLETAIAGQDVYAHFHFEASDPSLITKPVISLLVHNQLEVPIFLVHNRMTGDEFSRVPNTGAFVCELRRLPLPASTYRISYSVLSDNGYGTYLDRMTDAAELVVIEGDFYGSGEVPAPSQGASLVDASWTMERSDHLPGR